MNSLELDGGNALVVVAHPDDETIWMGGTMLKYRNVRWTILSLCRSEDPDRAPKFKRVARLYRARAIISDLEDEGILNIAESVPEIEKRVKDALKTRCFDYLFTHGYTGEYGHPRHKGVHRAIVRLMRTQRLAAKNFFTFAYRPNSSEQFAVPDRYAEYRVTLTKELLETKRNAIHALYGFPTRSFEYRSANSTETFNRKKII